jgi:hypothetical protein
MQCAIAPGQEQTAPTPAGASFRVVTTSIENIPPGWRARETFTFVGADEFTEVFELAVADAEFEVYSTTRIRRATE